MRQSVVAPVGMGGVRGAMAAPGTLPSGTKKGQCAMHCPVSSFDLVVNQLVFFIVPAVKLTNLFANLL